MWIIRIRKRVKKRIIKLTIWSLTKDEGSVTDKVRTTNRDNDRVDITYDTLGFRCVYEP